MSINKYTIMTNKEFFLKVLNDEIPRFRKALEALADDKVGYKVHERSREAGSLSAQIGLQWKAISGVLKNGTPDFDGSEMADQTKENVIANFDKGVLQLKTDLAAISEEDWENGEAKMGDTWQTKKYDMAWGFLFDAIHHRGQLTSYLRAMGADVPAVYGPSADHQN